jgi:hypothetical protein
MLTKFTLFRCPEDLIEKAKAKAARDRRSLSNYLITLIEKHVADVKLGGNLQKTPGQAKPAAARAKLKAKSKPAAKAKPKAIANVR